MISFSFPSSWLQYSCDNFLGDNLWYRADAEVLPRYKLGSNISAVFRLFFLLHFEEVSHCTLSVANWL
jgi:hypothetical protein